MTFEKITAEIAQSLKYYVYAYFDPRNHQPFYVGKGKGNRVFTHLKDTSETPQKHKKSGESKRSEMPALNP